MVAKKETTPKFRKSAKNCFRLGIRGKSCKNYRSELQKYINISYNCLGWIFKLEATSHMWLLNVSSATEGLNC